MTIQPNDPRLTAYAFGELDPGEAAHFEAELGESPDGQRALAEIRQTAELLRMALAGEPESTLSPAARGEILAAAAEIGAQPAAATMDRQNHGSPMAHVVSPDAHAASRPRPVPPKSPIVRGARWRRWALPMALCGLAVLFAVPFLLPTVYSAREAASLNVATNDATAYDLADAKILGKVGSGVVSFHDSRVPSAQEPKPVSPQSPYGATPGYAGAAIEPQEAKTAAVSLYTQGQSDKGSSGAAVDNLTVLELGAQQAGQAPAAPADGIRSEARAFYYTARGSQLKRSWDVGSYAAGAVPAEAATVDQPMAFGIPLVLDVAPRVIIQDEEEVRLGIRAKDVLRRRLHEAGGEEANTEAYDPIVENPFQSVLQQPLSTFSIDVDTASYANVRRFLNQGLLPPPGAVRIEELVNYFRYDYAAPRQNEPFAANTEVADCPWAPGHRLVRIALHGREIAVEDRPACNLVFLIDVSGSMSDANKLPLVKEGLRLLVEKLGENDRVAIVVYAGASGLALPSTLGTEKQTIMHAIDRLEAGGSTNGASGIQLAYDMAVANFIKGGANRVILATDGDFNVGVTDQSQLVSLIEKKASSGVFLSVLGFGMGNYKDSTLEKLADKGNGNYAYIDGLTEARKVLVEQLSGTLVTIAKDVKIQIEFNPARVQSYRLIGYENRLLAKEDFNNDKKDAGEIGAGHTVTALYEVVLTGTASQSDAVDKLEYQTVPAPNAAAAQSNDLLTLKLRYKEPDGNESRLLKFPVADRDQQIAAAGDDFEFASAVAAFGMLLRGSGYKGATTYGLVLELAQGGQGKDQEGYRREFIDLVKKAQQLQK